MIGHRLVVEIGQWFLNILVRDQINLRERDWWWNGHILVMEWTQISDEMGTL